MNGSIPIHVVQTLEEFKQQLAAKLGEVRRILNLINTLEESYGQTKTTLSELGENSQIEAQGTALPPPLAPGRHTREVRLDEFLGDQPLIAAKKYLKRVGHAVPFDEIASAIQRGGAAIRGSDWRENLQTSLIRSTFDIVKIQEGVFGLTEFYTPEQLQGLRSTRRRIGPVKKGKKRGRKRGRPKKRPEKAEKKEGVAGQE